MPRTLRMPSFAVQRKARSHWGGHETAQSCCNIQVPAKPAKVLQGFLKVNFDFEGITRHWPGQIVKFAIPRQTRSRPKQNLRLSTAPREKTQQNRLQKAGKALNMICSLCIGTSIAYQLPCSQLV